MDHQNEQLSRRIPWNKKIDQSSTILYTFSVVPREELERERKRMRDEASATVGSSAGAVAGSSDDRRRHHHHPDDAGAQGAQPSHEPDRFVYYFLFDFQLQMHMVRSEA